jgi:hypothetical protein
VGNVALDALWQAVNAAKLKAASEIMTVRRPSGWTVERKHLNKRNSPAETGADGAQTDGTYGTHAYTDGTRAHIADG